MEAIGRLVGMTARRLPFALIALLAGCPSSTNEDTPDGGMGDDVDGSMQPDAAVCTPACVDEANADVTCNAFDACDSTCETGFSRCGGDCVAESVTQCGAGCSPCPMPTNGTGTCSDGVCGVTCNAGYVPCEGYSGMSCCPFASEVVAPADLGGYMPSVAVDAAGAVHMAYYQSAEHRLIYAKNTIAGLTRETARWYWSSGGGARFELALGAKGPLILYTYPNSLSGLYLAEKRSTGWSHSKVADSTPTGFGFATDRAGRAHACFTTSAGLSYGIRRGDEWTITPVGDLDGKGACAVAVDTDGNPHIAYVRSTDHDLAYAKGDASGTFTTTTVDTVGFIGAELAITIATDGTPHVGYYASDTKDLRWATKAGGAWTTQSVSTGYLVGYPRIALGAAGPVMTWFDYGQYRVMIAQKNGALWAKQIFEDVSGGYGSIAAAPDGSTWIATGDRSVLLHNFKNGAAASYGIDFEDAAGNDIALLHRTPAQPVMIYDTTHDSVKHVEVATKVGAGWSRTQVPTAGYGAVAALDATAKVHLAYQTGTSLSYAAEASAYAAETIAATASQPSIAVDGTTVRVAYIATVATNSYALVLATRGASGWTSTTIGAGAAYGTYSRPTLRVVNGVVHLLWFNSVAKTIIYASSADSYANVTVETNADGGHDLWVSPTGIPHACTFRHGTSWPDQKYATRSGTTWSSVLVAKHGSALDRGTCAIRGDAAGTISIARSLVYGAGLGELVLTTLGATTTHAVLQDDFYSAAIGMSLGANGLEVAAIGEPYDGSGTDQNRVRWAHR